MQIKSAVRAREIWRVAVFVGAIIISVGCLSSCNTAKELQESATNKLESLGDLPGLGSLGQGASATEGGRPASGVCTSASDSKWVRKTQEDLAFLGYNPGPATGQYTQQTEQALRDYLWHHGYTKWKLEQRGGGCNLSAPGYVKLHSGAPGLTDYVDGYQKGRYSGNPKNAASTGYSNRGKAPDSLQMR